MGATNKKEESIMRLALFYFSGTGNTRYIARQICESLNNKGYDATAYSIEVLSSAKVHELIDNASIVGIGWPIYGSDIPVNMQRFIKNLPIVDDKPLLSFCTQYLFSGDGAVVMREVLESKGYVQKWAMQFNMPNNLSVKGSPFKVIDNYDEHLKKYLIPNKVKIEILTDKIVTSKKYLKGSTIFHTILALSQRPFFRGCGKKLAKRLFSVSDRCIGCSLCSDICPNTVIKIEDSKAKFVNTDECVLCFRCVNFCPKDSIAVLKTVQKPHYKGPDRETYNAIIENKKA
jgi:formate hydrogenlyase subunit 6/NADH:ubiquinone oxidoreductase subunit I/flavodoxin